MKKFTFYCSLILALAFFINISNADAQRKRRSSNDEYFDESGGFVHRLWYGGGFNLGFSGNNAFNIFNIGISPMVGYKIIDNVSIGPRVNLQYVHIKGQGSDGGIHTSQQLNYGLSAFSRFKFLENFFAHLEFEYESNKAPNVLASNPNILAIDRNGDVITTRQNRENFYIGAGYTSGGIFAYEILILYNTSVPDDSFESPFDYRFGFTYNF
ncbi:MAG: hypothetical protein AAGG75_07875 [Bacteroidota bacterium]